MPKNLKARKKSGHVWVAGVRASDARGSHVALSCNLVFQIAVCLVAGLRSLWHFAFKAI